MSRYHCTICPFSTDSPLGITAHATKHRNRFERLVGRPPEDYQEVRDLLVHGDPPEDYDGVIGRHATLDEF